MIRKKEMEIKRSYTPKKDFLFLMKQVPMDIFLRMAMKSGLPDEESRQLCQAFRELKQ